MLLSDPTAFDLDAYLARIGYSGPRTATMEVLSEIHLRHPLAIAFENLNPLLGWPVPLDTASVQQKMVHDRRGGYCFEHNLLLAHALTALGFRVSGLAARVMYNVAADAITPRGHMLLRVDLNDEVMIADVGFGGLTLTAPLCLERDVEQATPHELFRLARDRGAFVLQARVQDRWAALYRFGLEPQYLVDYEVTNWYLSHFPGSHFVTSLVAARPTLDRRYALRNNVLSVHRRDGSTERRTLNANEIHRTLQSEFGLQLPEAPELIAALERLTASATDRPALVSPA